MSFPAAAASAGSAAAVMDSLTEENPFEQTSISNDERNSTPETEAIPNQPMKPAESSSSAAAALLPFRHSHMLSHPGLSAGGLDVSGFGLVDESSDQQNAQANQIDSNHNNNENNANGSGDQQDENSENSLLNSKSNSNSNSDSHSASKSSGDVIILSPYKHERLIRTLFGATFHCKCIVNDEVRLTVWLLAAIGGLAVIGFFIADVDTKRLPPQILQKKEEQVAVGISALFTLAACILSYIQIRDHYSHWVHPPSQRCVVRILLMVPVYSISALASLILIEYSLYIDFIRGCYEAFVIYEFVLLLTKYLGGDQGVLECLKFKSMLNWPAPFCCIPPMAPDKRFLTVIKYGTLQYTLFSPICSIFAITMDMFGLYDDGEIHFDRGYVYVAFMQNCTQLLALYCLVWLYVVLKNELAPFKPMSKFLVVKAVVFFTFWQSVGLAILVHLSVLHDTGDIKVGQEQIAIQDMLVCFEMFIAAAAHKYTFGYETYANGTMKLLMDQRALYIAELHYKRAKEAADAEEAKKNKKLADQTGTAAAVGKAVGAFKKKGKKGKKGKKNHSTQGNQQVEIAIRPDSDDLTRSGKSRVAPFVSTILSETGEIQTIQSALPGLEDVLLRSQNQIFSKENQQKILDRQDADEGSVVFDDYSMSSGMDTSMSELPSSDRQLLLLQKNSREKVALPTGAQTKAENAGFAVNSVALAEEIIQLEEIQSNLKQSVQAKLDENKEENSSLLGDQLV